MSVLERLADRYARERFDIGRPGEGVYLTRYTLLGRRGGSSAVFLHHFYRGDNDDALHDHPWPFVSVILSGGYYEWTADKAGDLSRRWYGPGRVLARRAEHRHRVELKPGRDCWSLVVRGAKVRPWFFWCLSGLRLTGRAVPWDSFVDKLEAGDLGCGEP